MNLIKLPSIFRNAVRESIKSDNERYKVGACIIRGGKVVSKGHNHSKTHTITHKFHDKQTVHAEVAAIIKCRHKVDLSKCTMLVYKQNRAGIQGLARPCPTCMGVIKMFGIKEVIYTTYSGYCREKI